MSSTAQNPSMVSPLLTDLYQLTMAASYFHHRMFAPATFSLFVRNYPTNRGFFVAAGLAEAISYLEYFAFSPEELEFLARTKLFRPDFLDYLSGLRFTGDVRVFPNKRDKSFTGIWESPA